MDSYWLPGAWCNEDSKVVSDILPIHTMVEDVEYLLTLACAVESRWSLLPVLSSTNRLVVWTEPLQED